MSHPRRPSDKTPEELAAQRALRLQNRIARAILKEDEAGQNAVDHAIQTLRDTLALPDPKARRETKGHAAQTLLSAANRAAGNNPSTTINTGIQIAPGDLLRLVGGDPTPGTTGGSQGLPGASDPLPLPNAALHQGLPTPGRDLGLDGPQVTVNIDPDEATPEGVRSGDAQTPAAPPLPQTDATDGLGDPTEPRFLRPWCGVDGDGPLRRSATPGLEPPTGSLARPLAQVPGAPAAQRSGCISGSTRPGKCGQCPPGFAPGRSTLHGARRPWPASDPFVPPRGLLRPPR